MNLQNIISKKSVKIYFTIFLAFSFILGGVFQVLGSKKYSQNGPEILVQCQINWSGTNEYNTFYNLTSTPENYTVPTNINYDMILEKNQFYFHFSHNEGNNLDSIDAGVVIEIINDEAYVLAYKVKTDYGTQKESYLKESLCCTVTGTGQDSKSDWQDSWQIDVISFVAESNNNLMVSGKNLYISGFSLLTIASFVSIAVILILTVQNRFEFISYRKNKNSTSKTTPPIKWLKNKDTMFFVGESLLAILLFIIQILTQK